MGMIRRKNCLGWIHAKWHINHVPNNGISVLPSTPPLSEPWEVLKSEMGLILSTRLPKQMAGPRRRCWGISPCSGLPGAGWRWRLLNINYPSNWRVHCRMQLLLNFPPSLVPLSCPCFFFLLFSQTPCLLIIREITFFGCDYRNFQLASVIGCM